jgi:hypothetical protein
MVASEVPTTIRVRSTCTCPKDERHTVGEAISKARQLLKNGVFGN